jgi:hypothetical protein
VRKEIGRGVNLVPCHSSILVARKIHSSESRERRRVDTVLTTALSSPATEKVEEISADRFDEIMRQHQRRVYRVIYLLVRDADTADTLTQEIDSRARWSPRGQGLLPESASSRRNTLDYAPAAGSWSGAFSFSSSPSTSGRDVLITSDLSPPPPV